jgi:hypothetical protein
MGLKPLVEKQQHQLDHAELALNEALNALSQFRDAKEDSFNTETDTSTDFRDLQLVLQYRLSNHDAVCALLQCQQSLWQILGVSASASTTVNYERLIYALGRDDLHHLLTMLNQLADALLKLIGRMERKNESKKRAGLKQRTFYANQAVERTGSKARPYLQHAVEKQAVFTAEILDLTQSLQGIEGAPEIGAVLDEIAALKGPISRFYQALQHGMVLAGSLYQQLSEKNSFTPQLSQILNQVHQTLELATPHLDLQRFFSLEKANRLSGQDLEERARLKRMRIFL